MKFLKVSNVGVAKPEAKNGGFPVSCTHTAYRNKVLLQTIVEMESVSEMGAFWGVTAHQISRTQKGNPNPQKNQVPGIYFTHPA